MNKTILPFLVFLLLFGFASAQEINQTNTLDNQFSELMDKSNNYQDYKVVKKFKLNQLRKSVSDSVTAFRNEIEGLNNSIDQQKGEIAGLNSKLSETETQLADSRAKEDGISFFGMLVKKSTYNALMWTIIGLLLLSLALFISRFRSSNRITRAARHKLSETEMEFEGFRQRSLEREQQIRRKLQDEINKNKTAGV